MAREKKTPEQEISRLKKDNKELHNLVELLRMQAGAFQLAMSKQEDRITEFSLILSCVKACYHKLKHAIYEVKRIEPKVFDKYFRGFDAPLDLDDGVLITLEGQTYHASDIRRFATTFLKFTPPTESVANQATQSPPSGLGLNNGPKSGRRSEFASRNNGQEG